MIKQLCIAFLIFISSTSANAQINNFFTGIEKCSDEVFVRRAYLSITGRIPNKNASSSFFTNSYSDKRTALIDSLLNSNDYAIYFCNLWGDMLRIKSEFPSNLWPNGVQAYNRWIYERIVSNMPYNITIQQLLLSKGSNFRSPAVNFYRAFPKKTPENIYNNIQLLFLGNRKTSDNGKIFFTQIAYKSTKEWKEEIVYVNYRLQEPVDLVWFNDSEIKLTVGNDWREIYVDWLTSNKNKRFAGVMVNRLWYWIMNKGIVNEPDDWRDDNAPTNVELLNYLTEKFIATNYNMKAIMREMLLSDAFQAKKTQVGSFQTVRLHAEVMVDAIADITGIPEQYNSRVPEPFPFYPLGMRVVEIGDATVSSSTLELFGRASRDVSLESQHIRDLNARQLLYLANSVELETKIRKSTVINNIIQQSKTQNEVCRNISLLVLSRYPTDNEITIYKTYASNSKIGLKQLAYDLSWMMLNSSEFLFNH